MELKTCNRCGGELFCMGQQFLKKGIPGWHLRGDFEKDSKETLLPVEVWCCQNCRHLDFYLAAEADSPGEDSGIAKSRCPSCGMLHELDDPKCPWCGTRLY